MNLRSLKINAYVCLKNCNISFVILTFEAFKFKALEILSFEDLFHLDDILYIAKFALLWPITNYLWINNNLINFSTFESIELRTSFYIDKSIL